MAGNKTLNGGESDPYVDMDPSFNQSIDVVEKETANNQVSLKKIFVLLMIFLIIIIGGISGVYYIFYGNPTEIVADGWNPSTQISIPSEEQKAEPVPQSTSGNSVSLTQVSFATIPYTLSSHSATALITSKELSKTALAKELPVTALASNLSTTISVSIQKLTMNTLSNQNAMTISNMFTRTTAINDLEPITPNLRKSPVVYRFAIVDESKDITEEKKDQEKAVVDSDEDKETEEKSSIAKTSAPLTETEKKEKEKTIAETIPLEKRRKPIIFRASIPLILMYPELTLNFNSFLVLLPEKPSNTFVNIDVSLKTSNEAVFKEIQDRKTFVRGAIFGILKRMFESLPLNKINSETIKKRIAKDINYILVHGTVDKVYITNYLKI